jgi:hypothetical protein
MNIFWFILKFHPKTVETIFINGVTTHDFCINSIFQKKNQFKEKIDILIMIEI